MSITYTALELAIEKAEKNKSILFFHDYGNNYDVESSYDYFVFHKFSTIETFCEELYDYCKDKSGNNAIDYEFPDHFANDHFVIKLDVWKNIYVTNFPKNVDISLYEKQIMDYFENRSK